MTKKESTDLTTTDPNGLTASSSSPPSGYEGLDPSDFAPPWVSLCQALSDAVTNDIAKPGQFYNSGTGEALDSMRVVFVHVHKERDYYDNDSSEKCRSRNYITPDSDIESPFAQRCADCSKQRWVDRRRDCSDVFSAVAVNIESGEPFKMSFKKTSYASFRWLLGYMASKKLDLFGASVEMSSKKATKGKNTYHVVSFGGYQVLDANDREVYAAQHAMLLSGGGATKATGSAVSGSEDDIPF